MKTAKRSSYRPMLEALEERWCPTDYTWTGSVDAVWDRWDNWSPNGAPGSADTAYIGECSTTPSRDVNLSLTSLVLQSGFSGKTITFDATITVGNVSLYGGSIGGTGSLAVTSAFSIGGGEEIAVPVTFSGSTFNVNTVHQGFSKDVTINSGSTMDIGSSGDVGFSSGATLYLYGTLTFSAAGGLTAGTGSTVEVASSGVVNRTGSGSCTSSMNLGLSGAFNLSANTSMYWPLIVVVGGSSSVNLGASSTLEVGSGGLVITNSGLVVAGDGATVSGKIVIESGGYLNLSGLGSVFTVTELDAQSGSIINQYVHADGSRSQIVVSTLTIGSSATLQVTVMGTTVPEVHQEWKLFDASSRSGTFGTVSVAGAIGDRVFSSSWDGGDDFWLAVAS